MEMNGLAMAAVSCLAVLAAAAQEAPKPFSFVHDAKLAWNKKKPVSWVEKDGAKVLKLEGGPDGGSGKVDLKCPEAFERFRGMEIEFVLEYMLEDAKQRPSKWDKKQMEPFRPITWHWEHADAEWSSWERPWVKIPEGGSTEGWQVKRFRSCIEKNDSLKKAGIELHASFGSGALYVKDYRIEAAKESFMDGIVEKAGAKIPEGYRCEYSKKWLDGKKRRGIVAIWSFKPEDFEKIAGWGCDLVRMSRFKPLEDDYEKLEARLAVLKKHNIRVIFAPTTPGGKGNRNKYAIFNSDSDREKFLQGWEKLATYFKGRDDVWAFGIMNEPFQGLFGNTHDKYNYWQLVYEAISRIRAIDPDRPIVATADSGGSPGDYQLHFMRPYPFKDVWYELHFYSPLALTHYGVLGKRMDPKKQSYPGMTILGSTPWDKAMLSRIFDKRKEFAEKYGARWFVGEFSCMRCMPGAAQWLDDCCNIFDAADDVDMWAYHSYGEYHGWNLEYEEETPYEGKPKKMPKGEECSRMKVMKAHWAENSR